MVFNRNDRIEKSDSSLFNILNKIPSDSSKPNIYNYFYYKLFDFNGEALDFNTFTPSYTNLKKVELFKENIEEKEKYILARTCEDISMKYLESEDESFLKNENLFGPHRSNL